MEFIDHTGHVFNLPSYKNYPVGYEYEEQPYIFWLNDINKLSVDNYYIKPIRIILDEHDYSFTNKDDSKNVKLSIKIDSNYFHLLGSLDVNNLLNKQKNIFDYFKISSEKTYWDPTSPNKYDTITNEHKPGYVEYNLLKQQLTENDILLVQGLKGEYDETYSMITFYVVGYSNQEDVLLSNILVRLVQNNDNEYCVLTVGGEFVDENESLIINGRNMGINLPKDIVTAFYESSIYNSVFDNTLYNNKLKELLLNYINIKGECGNYNSAINAFKWFGWGDKISIYKLLKTDNEFINQYILDDFNITNDILKSYKHFKNTTYIKLAIKGTVGTDILNDFKWDDDTDFWGEGNPTIKNLINSTTSVSYDEKDIQFNQQYYNFCFEELGLKLSALEYFYKKYFLPLHVFIHSATITNQCYVNPTKLLVGENKTMLTSHTVALGDVFINDKSHNMLNNSVVEFPKEDYVMLYTQQHYVDSNYNEFNKYISNYNNVDYDLYWINENCLNIPISFRQKTNTDTEYYKCTFVLEKINNNEFNYIYKPRFEIEYNEIFGMFFNFANDYASNSIRISHKLLAKNNINRTLEYTDEWSVYMTVDKFKEYIKTNYFNFLVFGETVPPLTIAIKTTNRLTGFYLDSVNYIDLCTEEIIDNPRTVIFESNFDFIQKKHMTEHGFEYNSETLYKNFVIIPKILSKESNNYYLNNEFNLYVCVNGNWHTYNFTCKMPQLQLNLGTLKYKYYLDVDDSYLNKYGELTKFNQISKLTDDKVVFNTFMWEPKLVQVNNIDFYDTLLRYYKSYNYDIGYENKNIKYSKLDNQTNYMPIPVNDTYYVVIINGQKLFMHINVIKDYFITKGNTTLNIPLDLLNEENKNIDWLTLYYDDLNFIPMYSENTMVNNEDSIEYNGSSGIMNVSNDEFNESYLIQAEDGRTLTFTTINEYDKETYIYDTEDSDNFVIIMESDSGVDTRPYITFNFEIDENGIVHLFVYDINSSKVYLQLYATLYNDETELYDKYKEFPNIVNNYKYLNKVHMFDIYKDGKPFITEVTDENFNTQMPIIYNKFFNQDESVTPKLDFNSDIYDMYLMRTPYEKSSNKNLYLWYALFISKLPMDKYLLSSLNMDASTTYEMSPLVKKLYTYEEINDEIINKVIIKYGITYSDLYIVFKNNDDIGYKTKHYIDINKYFTDKEIVFNDKAEEFKYLLKNTLIQSIYNINMFSKLTLDTSEEIEFIPWGNWNVIDEGKTKFTGIHWITEPSTIHTCKYCKTESTLIPINISADNTKIIYRCSDVNCTGHYVTQEIEIPSKIYWNVEPNYNIEYKLLYSLDNDIYSTLNEEGKLHESVKGTIEYYSFTNNGNVNYLTHNPENDGSYLLNYNQHSDIYNTSLYPNMVAPSEKYSIYKETSIFDITKIEYREDTNTYVYPYYDEQTNAYFDIDYVEGLENEYINYYTYINNISIYSKTYTATTVIDNSANPFYLLYKLTAKDRILYNGTYEVVINVDKNNSNISDIINIYANNDGEKLTWVLNPEYKYEYFNSKKYNGLYLYTSNPDITYNDLYVKLNESYLQNDLYIKINEYTSDGSEKSFYLYYNILGGNYMRFDNQYISSIILLQYDDNNIFTRYALYTKSSSDSTFKKLTDIQQINALIDSEGDLLQSDTFIYIEVNNKKINIGKSLKSLLSIVEYKSTNNKLEYEYVINPENIYTINKDFITFDKDGIPSEQIYIDTFNNFFTLKRNAETNNWEKQIIYRLLFKSSITTISSSNSEVLYSTRTKTYYDLDYTEQVNRGTERFNRIIIAPNKNSYYMTVFNDNTYIVNDEHLWYVVNENVVRESARNGDDNWKYDKDTEILVYIDDELLINNKKWYYIINGKEYEYTGKLPSNSNLINNYDIVLDEPLKVYLEYHKETPSEEMYYEATEYYKFEYVASSDNFLVNRMYVEPTNGKNHFNVDDIIVTSISDNINKDGVPNKLEFKFDYGTKWLIKPASLKMKYTDEITSSTEIGIISIGTSNIKYDKGYYDIICKYSIDKNTQNLYTAKSRILVK